MQKQKLLLYGTQMKTLLDTLADTAEENAELVLRMEGEYKSLLSEQSFSNGMLASHLKKSILPAVAAYKTLIADGKQKNKRLKRCALPYCRIRKNKKRRFKKSVHCHSVFC